MAMPKPFRIEAPHFNRKNVLKFIKDYKSIYYYY